MQSYTNTLINDLRMYQDIIKRTQILVNAPPTNTSEETLYSERTFTILIGFKILLQTYLTVHEKSLNSDQQYAINKILLAIKQINNFSENCEYHRNLKQTEENTWWKYLQQHKDKILTAFYKDNEVYIPGGYGEHHTIYKLEAKINSNDYNDTRLYCTEYNAGAYSDFVDDQSNLLNNPSEVYKVWGVNKKQVIGDIESLIHIISYNYFSETYLSSLTTDLLGKTIKTESKMSVAQKVGNCSSRSTLEFIRDHLDENLFRDFFHYISKTNYNDIVEQYETHKSLSIKIADYPHLINLVLSEASIKLAVKMSKPLSQQEYSQLECYLIKRLYEKNLFTLTESDLIKKQDIISMLASEMLQDNIIKKTENQLNIATNVINTLLIDEIKENHEETAKSRFAYFIIKNLEFLLGASFSTEQIDNLKKNILNDIINIDSYYLVGEKTLQAFSYMTAQELIKLNLVQFRDDKIYINDKVQPQELLSLRSRFLHIHKTHIHMPNSATSKDLAISHTANTVFKNIFPIPTSKKEMIQCKLALKIILADEFPADQFTSKSLDLAIDCLREIIAQLSIKSCADLLTHKERVSTLLHKNIIHYAEEKQHYNLHSHIKTSFLGTLEKKNSENLIKNSRIINSIMKNIPAYSTEEHIGIHGLLKNVFLTNTGLPIFYLTKEWESFEKEWIKILTNNDSSLIEKNVQSLVLLKKYRVDSYKLEILHLQLPSEIKHLIQQHDSKVFAHQLLYNTAAENCIENIKILFKEYKGYTPLDYGKALKVAIDRNHLEIAHWLLSQTNKFCFPKGEDSPLKQACKKNNIKAIRMLVTYKSEDCIECFLSALVSKNTNILNAFTQAGFTMNSKINDTTPLLYALSNNNNALSNNNVVNLLIDKKVDVNHKIKDETPFMYACRIDNYKGAKSLLQVNNISIEDKIAGLFFAIRLEDTDLFQSLTQSVSIESEHEIFTPLIFAIYVSPTLVEWLISKNADVNHSLNGKSPLMIAYEKGNANIMYALISAGSLDKDQVLAKASAENPQLYDECTQLLNSSPKILKTNP